MLYMYYSHFIKCPKFHNYPLVKKTKGVKAPRAEQYLKGRGKKRKMVRQEELRNTRREPWMISIVIESLRSTILPSFPLIRLNFGEIQGRWRVSECLSE